MIIQNLETKLTGGIDSNNDLFLLMASSVYYHEQVVRSFLYHVVTHLSRNMIWPSGV